MTLDLARNVLPNLCFGIFAVGFGFYFSRSKQNLARLKKRLSKIYSDGKADLEAALRPVEGRFYNALNVWIGVSIIVAGISRFAAIIPAINGQYSLILLAFGLGQIFLAVGLQYIFTGKAFVYWRQLVWGNLNHWRPGLATTIQIAMVRLFGTVPFIIGLVISYVCLALILTILGVIDQPWFPWLSHVGLGSGE